MNEDSTTDPVDYEVEDVNPPDQASELGVSYYYTEAQS